MTRKETRARLSEAKEQEHFEEWVASLADPLVHADIKQAIKELEDATRPIHERLISEGYTFVDGQYIKPPEDQQQR